MQKKGIVVSLPDPKGGFQRFLLGKSNIMAPGLQLKHPEIATFSGRGIDDPKATIHADVSPLGFHASVRTPTGDWYIDPYYHLDQSVYASYFGHDMPATATGKGRRVRRARRRAAPSSRSTRATTTRTTTSPCRGSGFPADTWITITISDPEEQLRRPHDEREDRRLRQLRRRRSSPIPNGNLETHIVEASDPGGDNTASTSYQVVRADDPTTDPPTGDVLRTYRLALITDPGYADYQRRPGQRDRGEGGADQPRQPGLRAGHVDQAPADRATTTC